MARNVQTPGAAPKTTVDEEVKTTVSEATEQPSETTPDDQAQTGDTESETESAVDQAALIEQLQNQLAAAEANTQALKGQLRREGSKTTDTANAPTETVQAGTPYLSSKGWTRGA